MKCKQEKAMYRLESDGIESNFFLSTPLGIVTQNRSGQILSANPAVKNIFGLSPAEMCHLLTYEVMISPLTK